MTGALHIQATVLESRILECSENPMQYATIFSIVGKYCFIVIVYNNKHITLPTTVLDVYFFFT